MSRFIIDCVSTYDFLSEEYQALFYACEATVFQSPYFLNEFYSSLVPALEIEPYIILVREKTTKALVLVMPFVKQKRLGIKIVQPADLGVADYNCIIGRSSDLEKITASSFKKEIKKYLGAFDVMFYRKQRPETFDINNLFSGGTRGKNINSACHVLIEEEFDAWQKNALSKNFKKGLARKMRGLERDFGAVNFKALSNSDEIEKAFDFLRKERAKRYENDLLQTEAYFNFYKKLAFKGVNEGNVVVFVGQNGKEILSVEVAFNSQKTIHFILATFNTNPDYKRYSLGLQSILQLIKHQKDQGTKVFDFALGDEDYKQFFGAQITPMENTIIANSLIGILASKIYMNDGFLKKTLKKLAPNLS